jgi:hypothetical protein
MNPPVFPGASQQPFGADGKKNDENTPSPSQGPWIGENPPAHAADEDQRYFYKTLEDNGLIADIDQKTDVNSLPAGIQWVRYPDGSVSRR